MSQHDNQPWPWPTCAESERLSRFMKEPGVLIEEHQYPESIQVKHSEGRSLWATMLDPLPVTSEHLPEGPLPSLVHPVISEDRATLKERMKAVAREAPIYGARVQARSPRRKNSYPDECNDGCTKRPLIR